MPHIHDGNTGCASDLEEVADVVLHPGAIAHMGEDSFLRVVDHHGRAIGSAHLAPGRVYYEPTRRPSARPLDGGVHEVSVEGDVSRRCDHVVRASAGPAAPAASRSGGSGRRADT